jgi:hypothetical protein
VISLNPSAQTGQSSKDSAGLTITWSLLLDPGNRAGSSVDIEIDEPTADELRVHSHARRLSPLGWLS